MTAVPPLKDITSLQIVTDWFEECGMKLEMCNCIKNEYEKKGRLSGVVIAKLINTKIDFDSLKPFWIHLLNKNCIKLLKLMFSQMDGNLDHGSPIIGIELFEKIGNLKSVNKNTIDILTNYLINDTYIDFTMRSALMYPEFNKLFKDFLTKGKILAYNVLYDATMINNVEMVKYSIEELKEKPDAKIVSLSLNTGNINLFKYLFEKYKKQNNENQNLVQQYAYAFYLNAMRSGNLEMVKYLLNEYKVPISPDAIYEAIKEQLDTNIIINSINITKDKSIIEEAFKVAANWGNLEVVHNILLKWQFISKDILRLKKDKSLGNNSKIMEYLDKVILKWKLK